MVLHFFKRWFTRRKTARERSFRRRYSFFVEELEPRILMDASGLPPGIVVGRTLSSYFAGGVQNHQETITYTVYNELASPVTGVLLTDTLQPGVTFQSASQLPDQSGQKLAWSLGTINGADRASVTLTVALGAGLLTPPPTIPLQIDTGAEAFATVAGDPVSNATPAATLSPGSVNANLLASTPDANTADPYIQEEAAKLNYDPQNIFNFLRQNVTYNSYLGSVRGARGTLWSSAGNALDVASLGVALMRASGIPAQYESGTLSKSQAQQLILSMFPAQYQTTGYIPAGTQVADPANDPQLLSETESHYWFQFNTGGGFQNADPLMAGATIGQTFTSSTGTFNQVPDNLREKTEIQLTAEIYDQGAALFGIGDGLSQTVVLDQTFNDVDLVGRPLTIGNFVSSSSSGAIFTQTVNTYEPYLAVGDDANPDPAQDEVVHGQSYQDVLTNFALGSQVVTGLFLDMTLSGPQGPAQTYQKTLYDGIGYAARQGDTPVSVSVSAGSQPSISPFAVWTLSVQAGLQDPSTAAAGVPDLQNAYSKLASAAQAQDDSAVTAATQGALISQTQLDLQLLLTSSDAFTQRLASELQVTAYSDRPRIIFVSADLAANPGSQSLTLSFEADLLADSIRALAFPGQATSSLPVFRAARGIVENVVETTAVPQPTSGSGLQVQTQISAIIVLKAAAAQGIPLVTILPNDLGRLDSLMIDPTAKARITSALQAGRTVVVPAQDVTIGGQTTNAWFELNPQTGETTGVGEDGAHQSLVDYAVIGGIGALTIGIVGAAVYGVLFGLGFADGNHLVEFTKELAKGKRDDVKQRLKDLDIVAESFVYEAFVAGQRAAVQAAIAKLGKDPPVQPLLSDTPAPLIAPNQSAEAAPLAANTTAGAVSGALPIASLAVTGVLQATWNNTSAGAFVIAGLSAGTANLKNASGTTVGSGTLALTAAGGSIVPVTVAGNDAYSINGSGSLSFYGPAESSLGVSGNWDNYSATVTGNVTLTLTTDSLMLNGNLLPAGTYTITANTVTLSGSGLTTSPNFSGSASITATNATVNVGPGTGTLTVHGTALDPTNGATLTGYTGTIGVAPGGGNNLDALTLNGNAANVLNISATPGTRTTDQNTPVTFQINLNTSFADTYNLTAQAPPGWTVTLSATGQVTATPAPGLQGGTYGIQLVAQSTTKPDLVAQTTVSVTITPTAPGLNFNVTPSTLETVPFQGAQLPTAFDANIQNLGPSADTYNLTFANVPTGFTLLNSGTSVTVPAGQTGIVGVYLQLNAGQSIPAQGSVLSFTVTATSTTNSSITRSQIVTFTVPAIDAVTLTSSPSGVSTTPGNAATDTLTLTNVGNVAENGIALTATSSSGLTVTNLHNLNLGVGQSANVVPSLTPSAATPLNSVLTATITATYGPAASPLTQTLNIPVDVVLPGTVGIANASFAAQQFGNTALADRLNDLGIDLDNLLQNTTNPIFQSQVLADLDALIRLLPPDPLLARYAPPLTTDRAEFAGAVTAADYQKAATDLGNDLTSLAQTIADEAAHGFTFSLAPNSAVALANSPAAYALVLHNNGSQATTYDLSVSGLPANVTAKFVQNGQPITHVTLQPGQTITAQSGEGGHGVALELTETGGALFPTGFTVTVTAEGAPEITLSTPGVVTVRPSFVTVTEVDASPPFTNAGTAVDVNAHLLFSINQLEQVKASYTVSDPGGTTVFTSTPVTVSLTVQTVLDTVDLGSFSTTGLFDGSYTIHVTLSDLSGQPLPGGTGQGAVLLGTPVAATLATSPTTLPPGDGTVTTTLQVSAVGGQATLMSASVVVPTNNGVTIVPGSFNVAPTTITPGSGTETLQWNLSSSATTLYVTRVDYPPAIATVDPATNTVTNLFYTDATPDSLVFDGNGDVVYDTFANPGEIGLFDPRTQTNTILASGFFALKDMVLEPGGNSVLVSDKGDAGGQIIRLNLNTGAVSVLAANMPNIAGLAYDPNGNLFAVSMNNANLLQLDPTSGAVLQTIALPSGALGDGLTYDPVTKAFWIADNNNGVIEVSNYLTTPHVQEFLLTIPASSADAIFDGIESDGQGNLYVAEFSTDFTNPGRIDEYNIAGNTFTPLSSLFVDDIAPVVGLGAPPSNTFTWHSAVANLQAGEVRTVALGGSVSFTTDGGSGTLTLPGTAVTGARVAGGVQLSLSPLSQTVAPAAAAAYTVTVTNPTSAATTFNLAVLGVPAGWVSLPASVGVAANSSTNVTLKLTSDAFAALGDHGFTVTADDGKGATDSVQGDLILAGAPPAVDADAHGIVVSLTPAQATAGQGTAAQYVVQLTNTGSADDTFTLAATGLPASVSASFSQTTIDVPPGASNFRDISLSLTPMVGTAPGDVPFHVTATSSMRSAVTGTADGTLSVLSNGVHVSISPSAGTPGTTFQATIKNTGQVSDTFDLSLAGPASLVSNLGAKQVTLASGASQVVPISTGAVDFAVAGNLPLIVIARSHTNTAVQASDTANLQIGSTTGMTAKFDPASKVLPIPGTSSFLLLVNNTGNTDDAYSATITGTTGPITAGLVGLDGQPAQSVPIFRLPGLSSAAILLQTALKDTGQGTVSVQVQSLGDTGMTSTAMATVSAAPVTQPPMCGPDPSAPPNLQFVQQVYCDLFMRGVDPSGAVTWPAYLAAGLSHAQVAYLIETSWQQLEYRHHQVQDAYTELLHRTADPQGLAYWTDFLRFGGTVEQLEEFIASTPEYFLVHGSSDSSFLDGLYSEALGRAFDASGKAFWSAAMANGMSRSQVAASFYGSDEYRLHFVRGLYQTFLRREADALGLAYWSAALQKGMRDEQALAAFLGSQEYALRV